MVEVVVKPASPEGDGEQERVEDLEDVREDTPSNSNSNNNNSTNVNTTSVTRGEEHGEELDGAMQQRKDNLISTLTCSICQLRFRNPHRTNACLHPFCLECITPLINKVGDRAPCPLCRGVPIVPLKRDFILAQLIDDLSGMNYIPPPEPDIDPIYSKPAVPTFMQQPSEQHQQQLQQQLQLQQLQLQHQTMQQAVDANAPPLAPQVAQPRAAEYLELVQDILNRPSVEPLSDNPYSRKRYYVYVLFFTAAWFMLVLFDNIVKWLVYTDAINFQKLYEAGVYQLNFKPTRDAYLAFCIYGTVSTLFAVTSIFPICIMYETVNSRIPRSYKLAPYAAPFAFISEMFQSKNRKITQASYYVAFKIRLGRDIIYVSNAMIPLFVMNAFMASKAELTPYIITALVINVLLFLALFIEPSKSSNDILHLVYQALEVGQANPQRIQNYYTSLNSDSVDFENWNKIKYNAGNVKFTDVARKELMEMVRIPERGVSSDVVASLLIFQYTVYASEGTYRYFDMNEMRHVYMQKLAQEGPV